MGNIVRAFFDERAEGWNDLEPKTYEELLSFLKSYLPLQKGMKVLDVACGTGVVSEQLFELTGETVEAIDLSPNMISVAKRTHSKEQINFSCIDFMEMTGKFDFVLCFNAYPHFPDQNAFAKKASDLVKEGGYLAILHNMSRAELDTHHQAIASHVSRHLHSAKEEASCFVDFEEVNLIDNDEMYLILLKKAG